MRACDRLLESLLDASGEMPKIGPPIGASMLSACQVLGISFFNGDVDEAIASMEQGGGFLIAPSATCFARLRQYEIYRHAAIAAESGRHEKLAYFLRENLS